MDKSTIIDKVPIKTKEEKEYIENELYKIFVKYF